MTSIEWLAKELESHGDPQYCELEWKTLALLIDQAKEMHKQEVIDAYFEGAYGGDNISGEQYYQETFGSKGSDDHIVDTNEMVEISDEEITKLANEHILYNDSKRQWVIEGMKLYREQLKQNVK